MTSQKFNKRFRDLINQLINDGYTKYDICAISFGAQRMDQLSKFLSGRDLGTKPLSKVFDSLDYELHLIPLPKGISEDSKYLDELTNDVFESLLLVFNEYLENINLVKTKKDSQTLIIDNYIQKIVDDINSQK